MCRVLVVSRNSYYTWLRKSKRSTDNMLKHQVQIEFNANKGRYGARRIAKSLNKQGVKCTRKGAASIMKEFNL